MRDFWYGDKHDLIKWGVLVHLASDYDIERILYIAYLRPSSFPQLTIDGKRRSIPDGVTTHFRDLRTIRGIKSTAHVTLFDLQFQDRSAYLSSVLTWLDQFDQERCLVFLDPDTGLESQTPTLDHVLDLEVQSIWTHIKPSDLFVLYQHPTSKGRRPWIASKAEQLASALQVSSESVKVAGAEPSIHETEAVLYYLQKPSSLSAR